LASRWNFCRERYHFAKQKSWYPAAHQRVERVDREFVKQEAQTPFARVFPF
jgi:hypothetical protein